jgi:hypothetical protein
VTAAISDTVTAVDGSLPLGLSILSAALVWAAARITVALIESRALRRSTRVDELLHHVDAVKVAVGDVGQQVRDEVRRLREVVEHPGPEGGAR